MIASTPELGFNTLPVEGRANYPVMPGHHGDRSSREAAALASKTSGRLCRLILEGLANGPNNADALAEAYGEPWYNLRTRFSELAQFKAIQRTRLSGRSANGNRQGV